MDQRRRVRGSRQQGRPQIAASRHSWPKISLAVWACPYPSRVFSSCREARCGWHRHAHAVSMCARVPCFLVERPPQHRARPLLLQTPESRRRLNERRTLSVSVVHDFRLNIAGGGGGGSLFDNFGPKLTNFGQHRFTFRNVRQIYRRASIGQRATELGPALAHSGQIGQLLTEVDQM